MDHEDRGRFGSLLRRYRLDAGLTHEELAERSTVSVRTISDIERGISRNPHPQTVGLLAAALRLSDARRALFEAAARSRTDPAAERARALGNLPVQFTSFLGRERERRALRALLHREDVRLVTLTGPGGAGKTRLAIEVAADLIDAFEDGVVAVALAPVPEPAGVAPAIARALGASESAANASVAILADLLSSRQALLLLDNFEHLLDSARLVAELCRRCPRLKALVTSRAPLRLSGEQEFPVAPLPAPDAADLPALDALADNPAVALFVDRATRVRPDFTLRAENAADVAELCAQLDGLPLAIELAAARMKMLSPGALLRLLDRGPAGARLRLLSSGPRDLPARQRTMHETMRWSYDLLNPNEQRLLRRLAVFAGGCTLDAALAICGPGLVDGAGQPLDVQLLDLVAALADNSLIYQPDGPDHEPRYLLLETIREFALEHLIADGEEPELRRRHAAHYLALVESTGALLFAAAPLRTRAAAEQDNIQAALRWLVQHG